MKKSIYLAFSIILFIFTSSCSGYKPIFKTSSIQFEIKDYSISGEERLGELIYKNLQNIAAKNNQGAQSITLSINVLKKKTPTVKDSAGKILEYKINVMTNIIINDFYNDKELVKHDFNYSSSFEVQDQHSETIKLENLNIQNLINKTYQNIIIKISENLNK